MSKSQSQSPSDGETIRRIVRRADLTGATVDRPAVEAAVREFVSLTRKGHLKLAWVADLAAGLDRQASIKDALGIRDFSSKWWPVADHHWPWGGRSEFPLLRGPTWSDPPSQSVRERHALSATDEDVSSQVGRKLGEPYLLLHLTLMSQIAEWALWNEIAISRLRRPLPDHELTREIEGLLVQNLDQSRRRLVDQHLRYWSGRLNLDLRRPMVHAYAAGLFAFLSVHEKKEDRLTLLLVPRPRTVLEDGAPHRWDGPAVEWDGGASYWFWRGALVGDEVIERGGEVTLEDIVGTWDRRLRSAYIERFGRKRFREARKGLPADALRRPTLRRVAQFALETAADALVAKPGSKADGIVFGSSTPDLDEAMSRMGISDDTEIIEDEFEWPGWVARQRNAKRLIRVYKEPRGGMLTYQGAVAALTLISGRRVYVQWGDMVDFELVAVAPKARTEDDELFHQSRVDDLFLQEFVRECDWLDLELSISGDLLFQIDLLWTAAQRLEWLREALVDSEADWMSSLMIQRDPGAHDRELADALDRGEISKDQYDERDIDLPAAPPWFNMLDERVLDRIASLPLTRPEGSPSLMHVFAPWFRPSAEATRTSTCTSLRT